MAPCAIKQRKKATWSSFFQPPGTFANLIDTTAVTEPYEHLELVGEQPYIYLMEYWSST